MLEVIGYITEVAASESGWLMDGVLFVAGRYSYPCHHNETGSGANPVFSQISTVYSFRKGKAFGAGNLTLVISCSKEDSHAWSFTSASFVHLLGLMIRNRGNFTFAFYLHLCKEAWQFSEIDNLISDSALWPATQCAYKTSCSPERSTAP